MISTSISHYYNTYKLHQIKSQKSQITSIFGYQKFHRKRIFWQIGCMYLISIGWYIWNKNRPWYTYIFFCPSSSSHHYFEASEFVEKTYLNFQKQFDLGVRRAFKTNSMNFLGDWNSEFYSVFVLKAAY